MHGTSRKKDLYLADRQRKRVEGVREKNETGGRDTRMVVEDSCGQPETTKKALQTSENTPMKQKGPSAKSLEPRMTGICCNK